MHQLSTSMVVFSFDLRPALLVVAESARRLQFGKQIRRGSLGEHP